MRVGTVSKMFPVAFLASVCIFCSISSAQDVSSDERRQAALQAVAASNQNFSNSIYKILSKKEGNIFFSPISIEVILGLAYLGARGRTASQISRGLHLPEDDELITGGFNALITSIKSDDKVTLEIANKIFTDSAIPLKKEIRGIAQTSFHSDFEAVDFKTNHEAARAQINQWVEGKTNQKIKNLLTQGTISPTSALVLVNALYFKGEWVHKFDPYHTRPESFFPTPMDYEDVQMMHTKSTGLGFKVSNELHCKVLEMPYKGGRVSMVVFLPNELDGLANLEAKLPTVDLKQLLNSIEKKEVIVTLPKFKIEHTIDLNKVLKKLGMVDMFGPSANFSGLTEAGVKVSKVAHKAFMEVDEKGSEAAAATVMTLSARTAKYSPEEPKVFTANHPFLFVIREKTTQTVIFMGRVSDIPSS